MVLGASIRKMGGSLVRGPILTVLTTFAREAYFRPRMMETSYVKTNVGCC